MYLHLRLLYRFRYRVWLSLYRLRTLYVRLRVFNSLDVLSRRLRGLRCCTSHHRFHIAVIALTCHILVGNRSVLNLWLHGRGDDRLNHRLSNGLLPNHTLLLFDDLRDFVKTLVVLAHNFGWIAVKNEAVVCGHHSPCSLHICASLLVGVIQQIIDL